VLVVTCGQTDGRTDGTDMTKLLDALWTRFYSTYFIITGTFRECTNYYNNLFCILAEFSIYTSINIGKWTHCSHQLYPAVDCHRYCPVDLLWQEPLFPMMSSLMFHIADPATFVPDRNESLTPGIVTSRRMCSESTNVEKNVII